MLYKNIQNFLNLERIFSDLSLKKKWKQKEKSILHPYYLSYTKFIHFEDVLFDSSKSLFSIIVILLAICSYEDNRD